METLGSQFPGVARGAQGRGSKAPAVTAPSLSLGWAVQGRGSLVPVFTGQSSDLKPDG